MSCNHSSSTINIHQRLSTDLLYNHSYPFIKVPQVDEPIEPPLMDRNFPGFPKAPDPHLQVAPKATRRLLEDCAAQRLRDRRFAPVTAAMAVLGGGDLGDLVMAWG